MWPEELAVMSSVDDPCIMSLLEEEAMSSVDPIISLSEELAIMS